MHCNSSQPNYSGHFYCTPKPNTQSLGVTHIPARFPLNSSNIWLFFNAVRFWRQCMAHCCFNDDKQKKRLSQRVFLLNRKLVQIIVVTGKDEGKIYHRNELEGPEGSRDIAYHFCNLDSRWHRWSATCPGLFTTGKFPVPVV